MTVSAQSVSVEVVVETSLTVATTVSAETAAARIEAIATVENCIFDIKRVTKVDELVKLKKEEKRSREFQCAFILKIKCFCFLSKCASEYTVRVAVACCPGDSKVPFCFHARRDCSLGNKARLSAFGFLNNSYNRKRPKIARSVNCSL